MNTRLATILLSFATLGACAITDGTEGDDATELDQEIGSAGAWYHLDATSGIHNATLTVANGYKVRCPDGTSSKTCHVATLVLPASCNWECQDGLLGLQGEGLLRGSFEGNTFVVRTGLDTWTTGLGTASIYKISAAPTCTVAPCPKSLTAQKINTTRPATAITAVDFSHANDVNYAQDPYRADDQISSDTGLLVSGKIVSHVFRADRVWRLETPKACAPLEVARPHAYGGSPDELLMFRTVTEAERFVIPEQPTHWLVRTGESPTAVEFTSGTQDLWAERFSVNKTTCAITTLSEH